jgi:hypothetical protein
MAAKKFTVIDSAPVLDPAAIPDGLGVQGQALWRDVQNEYAVDDVGGRETLFQICAAKDMAVRLRERIDRDGEVVKGRQGPRENPLIKMELAHRAFIVRGLQRLGLNLEPLRNAPGRPSGFP